MTQPIYAIGDIHGQFEMLEEALERIHTDGGPDARIVFLGDYVDRGANSREVIELLSEGVQTGRNWIMLRGNHDRMFSMFAETYPKNDSRLLVGYHWLHERIGGVETLASYGVEVSEGDRIYQVHSDLMKTLPDAHRAFLKSLQNSHLEQGMLFVHAGIRPGIPLEEQTEDDLLWIRHEFLDDPREHPWLVVHGHTPRKQAEHCGNRVNLDAGAGYGRPLVAAVFEQGKVWQLSDDGRQALIPEGV